MNSEMQALALMWIIWISLQILPVDIAGTQNFCKSATKSDFVRTAAEVSTPVQIAKIFIRQ